MGDEVCDALWLGVEFFFREDYSCEVGIGGLFSFSLVR